jgi:hypothetical protein
MLGRDRDRACGVGAAVIGLPVLRVYGALLLAVGALLLALSLRGDGGGRRGPVPVRPGPSLEPEVEAVMAGRAGAGA